MSCEAMAGAWKAQVGVEEKLVLLALADNAIEGGLTWIGPEAIGRKTGLPASRVDLLLDAMALRGLLSRQRLVMEEFTDEIILHLGDDDEGEGGPAAS